MALVAANVLAVVLESVQSIGNTHLGAFQAFERFSVAVFSLEFAARFWVAAEDKAAGPTATVRRFRYLRTPMAVIDLLAIAPFYLSALFHVDLRVLRILRLLRIMKLTRYSHAFSSIIDVVKLQASALGASVVLLTFSVVLASSLIWIAEYEAQPVAFASIPDAMWWAIVTITTVGYGDVSPITPLGKFVGALVAVIGVATIALPTSILGSGFLSIMERRERALENEAIDALADGVLTDKEAYDYQVLAERMHVEPEVARGIIETVQKRQRMMDIGDCPHCGKEIAS